MVFLLPSPSPHQTPNPFFLFPKVFSLLPTRLIKNFKKFVFFLAPFLRSNESINKKKSNIKRVESCQQTEREREREIEIIILINKNEKKNFFNFLFRFLYKTHKIKSNNSKQQQRHKKKTGSTHRTRVRCLNTRKKQRKQIFDDVVLDVLRNQTIESNWEKKLNFHSSSSFSPFHELKKEV